MGIENGKMGCLYVYNVCILFFKMYDQIYLGCEILKQLRIEIKFPLCAFVTVSGLFCV